VVIPMSWTDRSIVRAERLDEEAVIQAIDDGARVVLFDVAVSCFTFFCYVGRRRFLIRPGESALRVGVIPTLTTALFGWWGVTFLHAILALYRNFKGGVDVTAEVREELIAQAAEKAARARAKDNTLLVASALTGAPGARRAATIELLDRKDVENAWRLVGADVTSGRIGRDVELLRKLACSLRDQRAWGRAAQVAALLRSEHSSEVKGYLATVVTDAERNGSQPDGYRTPTPLWMHALVAASVVGVVAMTVLGLAGMLG
jgi:hypothetical protein